MNQPIYIVTEDAIQEALNNARRDFPQRGEQPGPEWGYRNQAEVKSIIRGAKQHVPGKYDLTSVAQKVQQMETGKMISTANRGLIRLMHYLKTSREELKV